MSQALNQRATTTPTIREDIQRSTNSVTALSRRYGINPKIVRKWRSRALVEDERMGLKAPRSFSLTEIEEAAVITFRRTYLFVAADHNTPKFVHAKLYQKANIVQAAAFLEDTVQQLPYRVQRC